MKQTSLNGGSLSLSRYVTTTCLHQSELQWGRKDHSNITSNEENPNIEKPNPKRW